VGDQTALRGDVEGVTENMPGDHSNDRHGFLTILDNILTVGVLAGGEERADRPQHQSGGLSERAGELQKMPRRQTSPRVSGGSTNAAKICGHCRVLRYKKTKNKHASIYNSFMLIDVFQELIKHILYRQNPIVRL
jgi:hypothetical protein